MSETETKLSQAIELAAQLYRQGDAERAATLCTAVLAAAPVHADALHLLGIVRFQQGRRDEGLDLVGAALRANPAVAAAWSNLGLMQLQMNAPAQALACFDRVVSLAPGDAEALNHRGIALKAVGRFADALASYDAALALRPDYAEALNNRGNALMELKRPAEALASVERALVLDPARAEFINNRGRALFALERPEAALADYGAAVARKPDYAEAFNNRGITLMNLERPAAALADFDRALALRPDYPDALHNRGFTLLEMNRLDDAVANYDRLLALRPDDAEAHLVNSLCLLRAGDFEPGWREYEWRWQTADLQFARRRFPQPLWLGDADPAGRTILLHAEQGFGDTIQFCRYAKLVAERGARVVLAVPPALVTLVGSLDPSIRVIAAGDASEIRAGEAFDYHCPLMSLPLAFKTTLDTIPAAPSYLSAPADRTQRWRDRLGVPTAPRIGLVWSGNPRKGMPHANRIDRQRSIAFDLLAPLFEQADCEFFSLQKGDDAAAQLRSSPNGDRVVDWTDALTDFADTAALIANLDLVITVDTAVTHVAGALGTPFWLLNRFNTCWRWLLGRDDSPWYPTARIFRQPALGDWAPVIARVAAELRLLREAHDARRAQSRRRSAAG